MMVVRLATLMCVGVLSSACSGAEQQDVLAPSTSSSSSSGSNGEDTPPERGTPTGDTSGPTAGDNSDPSGERCTPEVEPNDDRDQANELETLRCGTLAKDVDELDVLTFTLPEGTRSMKIDFRGGVRLAVSVDGGDTVI